MELALFGLWCFVVSAAGGLVGLVLGNLRLPATVVVGTSAAAGAGANLAISAIAAATAAIAHVRARRVNWRLFAWMAPPSILGALAGGYLGSALPEDLLLGIIAAVLFCSAHELFTKPPRPRPGAGEDLHYGAAAATGAAGTNVTVGLLVGVAGALAQLPEAAPAWTSSWSAARPRSRTR